MFALLATAALAVEIAVTFDDLPFAGRAPQTGRLEATERLLAHLAQRNTPAVGFVNCSPAAEHLAVLEAWTAAGHTLGNHHATHANLNKVPHETWLEGVESCQRDLAAWTGVTPTLFRFPYLYRGQQRDTRDAVATQLAGPLALRTAAVSIDNHDWKIADWYAKAKAADNQPLADEIADAYVAHIRAATAHFSTLARDQHGREIKHILLLHANQLAADHAGRMLDALAKDGATFITVDQAMTDPVYALPDLYVGTGGISWLYRVSPEPTGTFGRDTWKTLTARFDPHFENKQLEPGTP